MRHRRSETLTLIWKPLTVIPAKAGIQSFQAFLDPGFRRGDGVRISLVLELTALGPTPSPAHLSASHPGSQALGRTHQVALAMVGHFVGRHAFAPHYANTAVTKSFQATVRSSANLFPFRGDCFPPLP